MVFNNAVIKANCTTEITLIYNFENDPDALLYTFKKEKTLKASFVR